MLLLLRFLEQAKNEIVFINTCLTINGAATAILSFATLVMVAFGWLTLGGYQVGLLFALVFVLYSFANGFYYVLMGVFIAKRRAKYFTYQNTLQSVLRLPLPFLLLPLAAAFSVFSSIGIATIVAIFISLFFFVRKIVPSYVPRPAVHRETMKLIGRFSIGNYVADLSSQAPGYLIPFIILALASCRTGCLFLHRIPSRKYHYLHSAGNRDISFR